MNEERAEYKASPGDELVEFVPVIWESRQPTLHSAELTIGGDMSKTVMAECLEEAHSLLLHSLLRHSLLLSLARKNEAAGDEDLYYWDGQAIATIAVALYKERMRHVDGDRGLVPETARQQYDREAGERAANDKAHLATLASLERRNQT